jgi:quercetin dioxygenase-like cupin family protein
LKNNDENQIVWGIMTRFILFSLVISIFMQETEASVNNELHRCLAEVYGLEEAPCAMILETLSDACNDQQKHALIDAFISQSKKIVPVSAMQQTSIELNVLDALAAAPLSHRILFENERFRILEDRVAPGETVPLHTHDWDFIMIILQGSRFSVQKAGEPIVEEEWGSLVEFYRGEPVPYSFTNIGEKEFKAIAFEIKPLEKSEQLSCSLKTSTIN